MCNFNGAVLCNSQTYWRDRSGERWGGWHRAIKPGHLHMYPQEGWGIQSDHLRSLDPWKRRGLPQWECLRDKVPRVWLGYAATYLPSTNHH